jgi:ABC-type nickel/cobalt efflux system permease component RcnA/ABC-type uncharacterized transport system substrate-binding protein
MMRRIFLFLLLVPGVWACALCSFYTPTADVTIDFSLHNDTIRHAVVRWEFTEKFTKEILQSYDKNDNKTLDEAEWEAAKTALIDYIRPTRYLTTLKLYNEADTAPAKPHPFSVTRWEFRLVENVPLLEYHVPIDRPIEHGLILSLQFKDEGRYFDFLIRSVKLKPSPEWKIKQNVNADAAFFAFYDRERYIAAEITQQQPEPLPFEATRTEPAPAQQNPLLAFLEESLKKLSDAINGYVAAINETGSLLAYFWLLLFSLLYGILHAAGPGHGKSLVSSYFLAHDHDYAKAYSVALMIALVHTFSAFIATLIIYFILDMFFAQFFADLTYFTTKISALLIILIALWLLYKKIPKKPKTGSRWSVHPPACSCGSCRLDTGTTDLGVIVSAGIIPCPGTVTIFILTLSLGEYFVGFLSALFMSLGMSLVILLAATLSIGVRKRMTGRFTGLARVLDFGSLTVILLLGVALLLVDVR